MRLNGRPTAATYLRRRALVLVGLAAAVFAVGNDVARIGENTEAVSEQARLQSETSRSRGPVARPNQPSHAATSATPVTSPSAATAAVATCVPSNVLVRPQVADGHVAGEAVTISLAMSVVVDQPCNWTVAADTVVLKIQKQGGRRVLSGLKEGEPGDVWSTQVCDGVIHASEVALQPDSEVVTEVTWQPFPGDEPGPDNQYCPGTREWMMPGKYTAFAAALGGEPSSAAFELR